MQQLTLQSELTIFNANEQKGKLLNFLGSGNELEINLSQVDEVDTAGLQLLILAKRQAMQQGKTLNFTMHSKEVVDILELANLTSTFGDQVILVHNEA
jgi:anti-sigma B factor antagonist